MADMALPRIPYDEDTEAALVAAVLHAPHVFPTLDLPPETFYVSQYRQFWGAFTELTNQGVDIGPATVRDYLRNLPDPERKEPNLWQAMSGDYYLREFDLAVQKGTANPLDVEGYAALVHRDRQRRLVMQAAQDVMYEAGRSTDLDHVMTYLHETWAKLNIAQRVALRPFSDALVEYYDRLARIRAGEEVVNIISSPWGSLDYILDGAQPGDFIVLGAPSSQGKSSFLWQWAIHAARLGKKVLFFSLEMTQEMLSQRAVAQDLGFTVRQQRELDDMGWGTLTNWIGESLEAYGNIQLYSLTQKLVLSRLLALVEQARQKGQVDIVFLDYLQLLDEGGRPNSNRTLEIEQIGQALLNALAIPMGLPVIAAAQLNETGEEPVMGDFRWGGAGTTHAPTKVLALWRPTPTEEYKAAVAQGVKRFPVDVVVLKNRMGPKGEMRVELTFDLTRMRFDTDRQTIDLSDM